MNSDKSYIEKGGILFGTKKDRYYINGSDTHTLVIGATRSGKSRSIVLPTIGIEGLAGENMVVSDPKGELHQYTYPFLEALGYNVFVLDFKNPDRSDHFNFLQEVIDAINDDNIPLAQKKALDKVFKQYHPQIIINAAAHKHVPLMEHNCVEAIYNNVFGTKNLIELCEKYNAQRFMMVSTDKAVNPTNVMGATKRMCEMMVQSASMYGHVKYSATRFGNVLGSAGSVIPLFKRQIAKGGPVTLTDKRIIRYFMTIPEASQLVLQSGAMANNGELFVLDMGQPVKILDLAENMIKLSGAHDIEIIETGLRPGEKLYEELLMNSQTLTKTDNDLIFIEKDTPLSKEEIDEKLEVLRNAIESEDDNDAREALRSVVPTFRRPEEINQGVK